MFRPTTVPTDRFAMMRFRFGIRALFVLTTLLACGLGWIAYRYHLARSRAQRAAAIQNVGALAYLDDGSLAMHAAPDRFDAVFDSRAIVHVSVVTSDAALDNLASIETIRRIDISGPVTDAGIRSMLVHRDLEDLTIDSDAVTDGGVLLLASLARLKTLRLSGARISDRGLACLGTLSELRILGLGETPITDAGLEIVGQMTELEELDLSGTGITNGGLTHLKNLRRLTRLNLNNTAATMGGLAHLIVDLQGRGFADWFPGEPHIEGDQLHIELQGRQFSDDVLPYLLKGAPGMTHLRLVSTGFSNQGLAEFGQFDDLRRLTLQDPEPQITVVEGLPRVTRLLIFGLGDHPAPTIRNMPRLETVRLGPIPTVSEVARMVPNRAHFRGKRFDRIVESFRNEPALDHLILLHSSIGDEQVASLREIEQLRELDLSVTPITNRALEHLGDFPNLEKLQIGFTRIDDSGIQHLVRLVRLRSLNVSGTPVTDASVDSFARMEALRELWLYQTGLTQSGLEQLIQSLPDCEIHFR